MTEAKGTNKNTRNAVQNLCLLLLCLLLTVACFNCLIRYFDGSLNPGFTEHNNNNTNEVSEALA